MKTVLLGDVAQIISGQSPNGKFYNHNAEGLPLYQGKKNFGPMLTTDSNVWTTEITKIAEPNDILISVRAPVGPVNFASQKMNIGRGLAAIRPWEGLDPKFLFSYLQYKEAEIAMLGGGTTFQSINRNHLKNLAIPYPDIEEQKRIVKKLDEALTAIDKAKQNTEKNLQSSQELFETSLNKMLNANPDWQKNKIIDVSLKITDGSHFSPKNLESGEFPYITVRDIENDSINFKRCKFINEKDFHELAKNGCQPLEGDLLFSKDGTVGKVSLVNFSKNFVVLSSLAIIRPNQDIIKPSFLKYVLKSSRFLNEAVDRKTGAAIRRIILKNLKQIGITYPKSLEEQSRVVEELDKLTSKCEKLQEIYLKKLAALEELHQSILKQAFEGKL